MEQKQLFSKDELVKMPLKEVEALEHKAWLYYKKIQTVRDFLKVRD
tara:strand:+ start:23 stop:160 length:138 start_codon:yes stop_codon:yes gene_type:complete